MIRNPLSWSAWAIAALAAAFIDRSPWLQGLLLLVVFNLWWAYRGRRGSTYWKVGVALAILPILFSAALSRFGHHVLVIFPRVPIIGGAWTWEAILYGVSTGVALLLTVAVFGIVSSTVRSADLLSLLPPPLYRAGTAVALSLAFAPRTASSFRAIREARRLRGHRSGWRSAPALLVPLLLTTLEQALQYGESLDARGYGSGQRSRYRPLRWSRLDAAAMVAALASLILTLVFPSTPYNPYADLAPAAPAAVSIIAVILLAAPAVTAALPGTDHADHHA